tara:strand:- start:205 stop:354 length:150 start_codon:yes stop_codon:yes gene_type:complete
MLELYVFIKKITSKNENNSTDNADKTIFELDFENSGFSIIHPENGKYLD